MNTASLWTGATLIAIISGTGGFFLGKSHQPASNGHSPPAAQTTLPASTGSQDPTHRGSAMGKRDIDALISELDRETDPLARFKLATRSLEAWMNADPKGALAWLKSQEPSSRRNELIRLAIGQFSETNPQGAAEWTLANLSGVELNNMLIRISEKWARSDGPGAAAWFSQLPATGERDAAMESLLFHWSADNPAAAIGYLNQHPGTEPLASILRYAAHAGWAKSDPRSAVAASLASSRTHQDPAQFANTLANWATMDPAASSQWLLENVKDPAERSPAVKELAGIFAHQSPAAGLAWIDRLAGAERAAALNHLAAEWADSDAPSAAQWLAAKTPLEIQPDTVTAILHGFLSSDAKGFEQWRASLPESPLKQQAATVGITPAGE